MSTALISLVAVSSLMISYCVGRAMEASENVARWKRAMDDEPFPEPEPEELECEDGDEEDPDPGICLRPGTRVLCYLSDHAHTHGVLVGFGMNLTADGPTLALVKVDGTDMPLPIDVDRVEPVDEDVRPVGYRDNADPTKQWN